MHNTTNITSNYKHDIMNTAFIYLKKEELNDYLNSCTTEITTQNTTENTQITTENTTENTEITKEITTENTNIYNYTEEEKRRYKNVYCVNCGIKGHVVKDCDAPITSFGIIAFKVVNDQESEKFDKNIELQRILNNLNIEDKNTKNKFPKIKFLMIQRKDTMGYIDFIRGKYPEDDIILRDELFKIFIKEMTREEKHNLLTKTFDDLWNDLWINHQSKTFINEYENAKRKFEKLDIKKLIRLNDYSFDFTEFSFAKGRKNMKETNIACAEREFFEETGYNKKNYNFIKNYPPICEEFTGTNGINYKHIYYLVKMKDNIPPPTIDKDNIVQTGEVRNIGWFTYDECISLIRPYDTAKKNVITKVYNDVLKMNNNYICSEFYYSNSRRSINRAL